LPATAADSGDHPLEFERLWLGFMTARATLGGVLVVFQSGVLALVPQSDSTLLWICLTYFAATLTVRLTTHPQQLRLALDAQWLRTVGVDVLAFASLQMMQGGAINYTPLLALPVLMVSVLGSMLLAIATAASITLLLLAHAFWLLIQHAGDAGTIFLQAALTGAGCFAIAFISNQLATRLASMELRAQRNQLAATEQRQVNELVIQSLTEGVLVVDGKGKVRSANPAAYLLLDTQGSTSEVDLGHQPGTQGLMHLIESSFISQAAQQADISLNKPGRSTRRLRVRTQLTGSAQDSVMGLCVVFMQDQREVQARIRSEKLAGMGRMSAAMAHEIRNPLAAITQANALLAEELSDPAQQRLAQMVGQNALRLENIVKDVLHLTHAGTAGADDLAQPLNLCESTQRICRDWCSQHAVTAPLVTSLPVDLPKVWFDVEHLRRVLINLLDNALRYASQQPGCIQVGVALAEPGLPQRGVILRVWSDGAVLDTSMEQHLFEPFFSTESRSSGLGLYICRELCESHGANISYERSKRQLANQPHPGNEFSVTFKLAPSTP
jgi:two-component system, NtrC family, sensor histidine kinase PilS